MTAYREIAEKIRQADAVLIGASNGLSITEGLHLFADNQAFDEVFEDLKRKYGLRCILQGMGAKWPSEEEKWGFWSRLIRHYCGEYRENTGDGGSEKSNRQKGVLCRYFQRRVPFRNVRIRAGEDL